jgi:hypothetical protein
LLISLGMCGGVVYFACFIRNCVVLLCIEPMFAYFIRNCCIERIFAYLIRKCVVLLWIEHIFAYFIRNV